MKDLRYSLRMLRKDPGFTFVAVLALTLGIGANTAIFSIINTVLLRPLVYREPDRLTLVWASRPGREHDTVSPANFLDWRSQSRTFEEIAGFSNVAFNFLGGGDPERVRGASVSTNFFRALGVSPALGNTFETDHNDWKAIVLSHDLWQRRFGSDPGIIGRRLDINDQVYTVLAVMPKDFKWAVISPSPDPPTEHAEFWVPAIKSDIPQLGSSVTRDLSASRNMSFMRVVGRLKPGVSIAQAQAEMDAIAARLEEQYPESNTGSGIALVPLARHLVGNTRPALMILFAAVGFVLLIACANAANLLLVRGSARRKEIAIRLALGASRRRLIRQLLVESLTLALIAGGLGILVAMWAVTALASLGPADIPGLREVSIDARVLGFTLLTSVITGLVFGLLPAVQSSRTDLNEALKDGGRASSDSRRAPRNLLVVSEVALALVLLVGSGLLLKSFLLLQRVEPGFDTSNLLTFTLSLPESRYPQPAQKSEMFRQTLERINALPGVVSCGAVLNLPLGGDNITLTLRLEGEPPPPPGQEHAVGFQLASPGYFETMRIPIIAGREFSSTDTREAAGVVIINQTTARRHWPGEDAIGKRIKIGGSDEPWLTIVGIVGDVKHGGLIAEPRAEAYISYLQEPFSFMDIAVRTEGDPLALVTAVRSELAQVDPNQPIANIRTVDDLLAVSTSRPRFTSILVGIFAALALALAAIGIYGVISYSVTQRTHEIGIRMALGARPGDVFKLVIGQGLALTVASIAIGLAASLALTQFISSQLFAVSATDPPTYLSVSGLLAVIALVACYTPARRATKVDPMIALRYE